MTNPWPALIRYNPRVLTPPCDWAGAAEWCEAGLTPDAALSPPAPVAVKLSAVEGDEWRALTREAAALGVAVQRGRQGAGRPVLLAASGPALKALAGALGEDGEAAQDLSIALGAVLEAASRRHVSLPLRKGELRFDRGPLVMGVVNVTPDSFSDGGRFLDPAAAIAQGLALAASGADLVDVGGESTRPGAEAVEAVEEARRVVPIVAALAEAGAAPVSIDTSKAEVARACVEAGAVMVNDVTALAGDEAMADTVADLRVPVCAMHMRGTPRTMQADPRYDDLVGEVILALRKAMAHGVARGIDEARFLVDPGIGFGKTARHNLTLLNRLNQLRSLGRPILVGTSRKSFIGKVLADEGGDRPVDRRLLGTAGSVALAVARGAQIVRVHDVAEMRDVVRVVHAISEEAFSLPRPVPQGQGRPADG